MKKDLHLFELDKLISELKDLKRIQLLLDDKKPHALDNSVNSVGALVIPERLIKKMQKATEESIQEIKDKITKI